ncbi:hypothetical protein BD779DRAFT_1612729 [Infundibulicybe gibba]|nr:hypothetical protein BD779DRAFT_1612729 [Infundibulicybe gibba]
MIAQLFSGFPPTTGIRWFNLCILTFTPAVACYGLVYIPYWKKTIVFAAAYYIFSMLGYHRLWSHRSYNASKALQYFLLFGGTSAVQGSCLWWARAHRSHHRHTDTNLDPYNANRGLLWTHIGWMIFTTNLRSGSADISDLKSDSLIQWQHRWYFCLLIIFGYLLPALIPGIIWNDWMGGLCFSAALRLTVAHHSTFCINSIAHYLGSASYDDELTPRDHLLSAILTMGEGYHNFHHQFPMDYRNAFLWYQYDPTKWFIALCKILGLATHLRVFSENEIKKGALTMKLKQLQQVQESLDWPTPAEKLPIVTWDTFQRESAHQVLILVSGFIHDASLFVDEHPGGREILAKNSGSDMTPSFFGGVYAHSNAAHNLLSMMRVGILDGGVERPIRQSVPPAQRLYVAQRGSY